MQGDIAMARAGRIKLWAAATATVLGLALTPAAASADSIVYIRDGNVWIAAPDGSRATQLTSDGGYESPSEADDGTIVAGRKTQESGGPVRRLYRMNRSGRLLNPPAQVFAPGNTYIGPISPVVSPDGRRVAFHYLNTGALGSDYPYVAVTASDRDATEQELSQRQGYYLNPSWLDNNTILLLSVPQFTLDAQTYTIGGDVQDWFEEPDGDLGGGADVSADGAKMIGHLSSDKLRLYSLNGPPPAPPTPRCDITGPSGSFHINPRFAPDSTHVAWAEDDGIHVGSFDLGSCAGDAPLVIPGADSPFWGPADPPTSTGGGGPGALGLSVKAKGAKLRTALAHGYSFKASCDERCAVVARLRQGGKTVATSAVRKGGPGTLKVVVKFTKKAKKKLRSKKSVRLKLEVAAIDPAGNGAEAKRAVVLKR